LSVQEIAPGVFVASETTGANFGLVQTDAGSVLIDAPWIPSQARAWRKEVELRSPNGVAYRIHTDDHLDHILGSCFMPPALTVAHETAWKHLKGLDHDTMVQHALEQAQDRVGDLAAQLAEVSLVMPEITVGKGMALWCAGRPIEIIHLGGHSPASLAVFVPDRGVLFAGDLVVNGIHPYMADANSREWISALEQIRTMDVRIIVPGHGQPGGLEIIERLYEYLVDFRARVEASFRAGHTRRETVERVRPIDAFPVEPGDEERVRRILRSSVERVYDEIKKEALRNRQRA
jgi:cyclase